MCSLQKSEHRSCAIGTKAKAESTERKRVGKRTTCMVHYPTPTPLRHPLSIGAHYSSSEYCLIAQTKAEGWLKGCYSGAWTRRPNPSDNIATWNLRNLLGVRWLVARYIHPLDRSRNHGFPEQTFASNSDDHISIFFVRSCWPVYDWALTIS